MQFKSQSHKGWQAHISSSQASNISATFRHARNNLELHDGVSKSSTHATVVPSRASVVARNKTHFVLISALSPKACTPCPCSEPWGFYLCTFSRLQLLPGGSSPEHPPPVPEKEHSGMKQMLTLPFQS